MQTSIFLAAVAIASVYVIFRFIEMRFILKENKPLKLLLTDSLIVLICSIMGKFIYDQFDNAKEMINMSSVANVFTGPADF